MAQFTHSLCEEVIRTNGKCGLTRNEMVQMARLALRALNNAAPAPAVSRESATVPIGQIKDSEAGAAP